jgi:hypothetical protein
MLLPLNWVTSVGECWNWVNQMVQGLLVRGRISSCFDCTCEIAERGNFHFKCLWHFILTQFDLSYQASQSGMQ